MKARRIVGAAVLIFGFILLIVYFLASIPLIECPVVLYVSPTRVPQRGTMNCTVVASQISATTVNLEVWIRQLGGEWKLAQSFATPVSDGVARWCFDVFINPLFYPLGTYEAKADSGYWGVENASTTVTFVVVAEGVSPSGEAQSPRVPIITAEPYPIWVPPIPIIVGAIIMLAPSKKA